MNFVSNIRVVMIETSHPGNIGAAARAMKNMSLHRLVLVNPKQFPAEEATARASGADDLLATARVCASLDEAVADCQLVIGASARLRSVEWPQLDARECGQKAVAEAQAGLQVAVLFGREHSGLTNEELDRCHYLMHIPTNPHFQSLNVAAAIQVVTYEIQMASLAAQPAEAVDEELADVARMEGYFQNLQVTMQELGFMDESNVKLMRRLRRLYQRARPSLTELDILHGILSAAKGKKYQWMKDRLDLLNKEVDHITKK
ncbi:MAG: RNA methyltransferase [Gammaproteobacteria bacterium]|nr:RNA methyltransferase [Gammaproteobacteria bacterium]